MKIKGNARPAIEVVLLHAPRSNRVTNLFFRTGQEILYNGPCLELRGSVGLEKASFLAESACPWCREMSKRS